MTRAAMLSFVVAALVAAPGCEKKDTNVPEAPLEDESDFSPPEEEEFEGEGEQDEEKAPNLSRRRNGDGV